MPRLAILKLAMWHGSDQSQVFLPPLTESWHHGQLYSPVYVVLGIEFSVLLGKHVSPKLLHTVYKVLETLMSCVFCSQKMNGSEGVVGSAQHMEGPLT